MTATPDPRIEAGKDALTALGVPSQHAWDYAAAVLGTVYTREEIGR